MISTKQNDPQFGSVSGWECPLHAVAERMRDLLQDIRGVSPESPDLKELVAAWEREARALLARIPNRQCRRYERLTHQRCLNPAVSSTDLCAMHLQKERAS